MARPAKKVHDDGVSLTGYVIGFVLSLILTFMAFWLVTAHVNSQHSQLSHDMLVPLLAALAFAQFIAQIVFFLHLSAGGKNPDKVIMFWFMTVVVLILVVGSVWIMDNLNYNMMSPEETKIYMKKNQGF